MIAIEERYVPVCEPYLSEWCTLHSLHLTALSQIPPEGCTPAEWIGAMESLFAAVDLADAKYRLYCRSLGER